MMLKTTVFAVGMTFSAIALAGGHGDSAGNGGTVMVCQPNTAAETLMTYDIYEGQAQRHLSPQMGEANLDYLQKVEMVLNRIPTQNAEFRGELRAYLHEFQTQSEIGDFDLIPVDDTGQLVLAPGCVIRQAAVQREPMSSVEKRYFLDRKIWDRLDQESKAALVLHEIVYRLTIVRGHKTSVGARLLNSYLMNGSDVTTKPCMYLSLLNDLSAASDQFAKIGDLTIVVNQSSLTPSCQIEKAVVVDGYVTVRGEKIHPANAQSASLFYDRGGHVQQILINQTQTVKVGGVDYEMGFDDSGLGQILFDEQENIIQANVNHIDVTIQGHHVSGQKGILYFAADGKVTGVSVSPAGFSLSLDGISFENVKRMDMLNQELRLWVPHEVTLATPQGNVVLAGLFFFSDKDQLLEAMPIQDTELKIGTQSCVAASSTIHFFPGHAISRFVASKACELTMSSGEVLAVRAGNLVSLNEQGQVVDIH